MCGIAGFTGGAGGPDRLHAVGAGMADALRHRGPEAWAVRAVGDAVLAACELAFVTPGRPHQPLVSDDGEVGVVLNGEIYNFAEVAERVAARGGGRPAATDTELVLDLYRREGPSCVGLLRGMYALAVHDRATATTLLARDPLGKKPLYWFRAAGGVVFASEIKALLVHPECPREPDPRALLDYLTFNAVPSPATPWKGVAKLRPGTLLLARPGGVEERRFWSPVGALGPPPEGDPQAEIEARLERAVARRLGSTALPLGVLLSGGIDSSLVAALAARASGAPLKTFTAGFDDPGYDEEPFAARVAAHLGAEHRTVRLDAAALVRLVSEELPRIDEPLADPALLPMLAVSRLAAAVVKGVLSGDGADEMLFGYAFFRFEKLAGRVEPLLPRGTRRLLEAAVRRLPVEHSNMHASLVLRLLVRGLGAAPERRFYESTCALSRSDLQTCLRPEARRLLDGWEPYAELDRLLAGAGELDHLRRCQLGMIRHFLQDVILAKVDRASMLHSLEVRSPFLDLDFVELALRLPPDVRVFGGASKAPLRTMAARLLPAEVCSRRKQGFRVPIARLLCAELRPLLTDLLSPAALRDNELFEPAAVHRLLDEHLRRRRDNQKPLWALLCLELWRRTWQAAAAAPPPVEAASGAVRLAGAAAR